MSEPCQYPHVLFLDVCGVESLSWSAVALLGKQLSNNVSTNYFSTKAFVPVGVRCTVKLDVQGCFPQDEESQSNHCRI